MEDLSTGPQGEEYPVDARHHDVSPDYQTLARNNDRLASALRAARQELAAVHDQVRQLTETPNTFGVIAAVNRTARTVDAIVSGRKLRCSVAQTVPLACLSPGREVVLNEHMCVISSESFDDVGDLVMVTDFLDDARVTVRVRDEDEKVLRLAESLISAAGKPKVRPGDIVRADVRGGFAYERVEREDTEELMLEEVPDVDYEDVGGLTDEIASIRDSIEVPFLFPSHYRAHRLRAPKGILLYGPPGCGKTLIAKAVATSLARTAAATTGDVEARSFFISVKGPELLTKYVGETERQIRKIFSRARQRAKGGMPVIVFFDEMDSLFRTRGTGRSSDVETTIVPQLLAEIDGVEELDNVIVIGATNREDMIDPAIVRPGRLDVKIRISRPTRQGAADILAKYLVPDLPLDRDEVERAGSRESAVDTLIRTVVERLYVRDEDAAQVEVTFDSGDTEILYAHDFASGAMLANIVDRAKKLSIKDQLAGLPGGLSRRHMVVAVKDEVSENASLHSAGTLEDWERLIGRRGQRITRVHLLRKQ